MDYRCASSDDDGTGAKKLHKRDGRLGEEDWVGEYEEQILDLYDEIRRLNTNGGWPIFDKLRYADFAHFAWKHSTKYTTAK